MAAEESQETPLRVTPFQLLGGEEAAVRRIVRDVSFDCSPDTMVEVLSDLERSPDVSAVSRVFVRKLTNSGTRSSSSARNVGVTVSVETWAIAREGGAS